ncbi:hypothetical protein CIPAW_15G146700 [Carya illinoinensis]|uniref:Uncharacterized protein n=1 Tax=Carya illinoinensis TaxID=32201 RepID=A0A8T1ND15_CARIL|nr:hypothetical protein CIPAW_15G146700 [Carya illinoinensis]
MKVLWFLVRLYCVFLLIFLHASFGTAKKGAPVNIASPNGREADGGQIRASSPSRPIGKPPSHP